MHSQLASYRIHPTNNEYTVASYKRKERVQPSTVCIELNCCYIAIHYITFVSVFVYVKFATPCLNRSYLLWSSPAEYYNRKKN